MTESLWAYLERLPATCAAGCYAVNSRFGRGFFSLKPAPAIGAAQLMTGRLQADFSRRAAMRAASLFLSNWFMVRVRAAAFLYCPVRVRAGREIWHPAGFNNVVYHASRED